jgi:serine/threonine-protein phosphatase 6 regulatory ankyrin repeat subunit B
MNDSWNHEDNSTIRQFEPVDGQWELNDTNFKLINQPTGETILHNYCQFINSTPLAVFKYLIEMKGCNINAQNNHKITPIHIALRFFKVNHGGDVAILSYLLRQNGLNVNTKNKNGRTLLHWACEYINFLPLGIFKYLIETQGCSVNLQDNNNNTPLYYAFCDFEPTRGGDITVLTYLLSQAGVDVNIKGQNGYTLLHRACIKINALPIHVFKYLIEIKGGDINAKANNNDTPLYYALNYYKPNLGGNIAVLTYLVGQERVNMNLMNRRGCTLLHLACNQDCTYIWCNPIIVDDETDSCWSQVVQIIVEKCIQRICDRRTM